MSFRTRIKLNKGGRAGIPLRKLASMSRELNKFLDSLCSDMEINTQAGEWMACNFNDGSVIFDNIYEGPANAEQLELCRLSLNCILSNELDANPDVASRVGRNTLQHFAALGNLMGEKEELGFGLYSNGEQEPKTWKYVTKERLTSVQEEIANFVEEYGAIQGRIDVLNKGAARKYFSVRELSTDITIKCFYDDRVYGTIIAALKDKDTIVHVSGRMKLRPTKRSIDHMIVERLEEAAEYKSGDLEAFFGCAPNLTGRQTTAAFIAKLRKSTHD